MTQGWSRAAPNLITAWRNYLGIIRRRSPHANPLVYAEEKKGKKEDNGAGAVEESIFGAATQKSCHWA